MINNFSLMIKYLQQHNDNLTTIQLMENLKKKIQLLLNLYKSKNLSKAELLNKELISAHPKVVNLYNVLGLILTEQKKIDEAIMYYEKGIKIDPDYAVIYNNLGSCLSIKRRIIKRQKIISKNQLDLDIKMPKPQNNLGNLYLDIKQTSRSYCLF